MPGKEIDPNALAGVLWPIQINLSPSGDKVVYATRALTQTGDHAPCQIHLAIPGQKHSSRPLTPGFFNDESPMFSPADSSIIAFLSDRFEKSTSSAIYVLSTTGPGEATPVTPTDNRQSISKFEWSPCGRYIAFLSSDPAESDDNPDWEVFSNHSKFQRLRVLDLSTKDIRTLDKNDRQVMNFAWTTNGLVYSSTLTTDVESSITNGSTLTTIDLKTGINKDIYHHNAILMGSICCKDDAIYFNAMLTPKSVCSSATVYKLSLTAEAARCERLTRHDDRCFAELRYTGLPDTITAKCQFGLNDEIVEIDEHGDIRSILYSNTHSVESWNISTTPKGSVLVMMTSDINTPFEVYSTSTSPSSSLQLSPTDLIPLSCHNAALLQGPIGTTLPIAGTSEDGTPIDGILVIPEGDKTSSASGPVPLFVFPHSGPYHRSTSWFSGDPWFWLPYLVSCGYAVLEANYRGGSSHGEAYAAGVRHRSGTKDLDDINALLRHTLTNHPDKVDPTRISIGGWSAGGFLSYLGAVQGIRGAALTALSKYQSKEEKYLEEEHQSIPHPFHFRAAVCGAGAVDWDLLSLTSDMPVLGFEFGGSSPWTTTNADASTPRHRNSGALGEMQETAQLVESAVQASKASPDDTTLAKSDLLTPFLILHGENDARIPVSQAKAFKTGCKIHDWPFEMCVYKRGGHVLHERKQVADMMERVKEFLDEKCK